MFQRIKDWIIKKLGGATGDEYQKTFDKLVSAETRADNLAYVNKCMRFELVSARDTIAGFEILKTKIETFRAEGSVPRAGRSVKQLQQRVDEKKVQVVSSLVNDLLDQKRFIVIDVDEKSNKVEVKATISVLEGGVINGEEAQLSKDQRGTGESRESGEAS